MAILAADRVTLSYLDEPILRDVSLGVSPGELLGLVGPNGSGKSTLVRALSGVLPPRSGRVTLDGQDLYRLPARTVARAVAVVGQETPAAFGWSVLDVVLMGRSPHLGRFGLERRHDLAVAQEALERTAVSHLAGRPFLETSGGERQRVMIARALAQEPQILILDEPTAHLDLNHQIEIVNLVASLRDRGLGVLAVLHDLNMAAAWCDRVALLHEGRLRAVGKPAEALTPEHVRAAYGTHVMVKESPVSGRPYLTAATARPASGGRRVHMVCGAGTGEALMRSLSAAGCAVSAGVLNVEDSDQQAAELLDLARVEEAPFSPIGDEAHARHLALLAEAAAVVVTALPWGRGNVRNLEAALAAAKAGTPVYLLEGPAIEERDFTGGEAARLWRELLAAGAVVVGESELPARLGAA